MLQLLQLTAYQNSEVQSLKFALRCVAAQQQEEEPAGWMERLLNFEAPLDIALLDAVVGAFYSSDKTQVAITSQVFCVRVVNH